MRDWRAASGIRRDSTYQIASATFVESLISFRLGRHTTLKPHQGCDPVDSSSGEIQVHSGIIPIETSL